MGGALLLRSGLVSPELHVSAGVASAGVGLLRFKLAEFPIVYQVTRCNVCS